MPLFLTFPWLLLCLLIVLSGPEADSRLPSHMMDVKYAPGILQNTSYLRHVKAVILFPSDTDSCSVRSQFCCLFLPWKHLTRAFLLRCISPGLIIVKIVTISDLGACNFSCYKSEFIRPPFMTKDCKMVVVNIVLQIISLCLVSARIRTATRKYIVRAF